MNDGIGLGGALVLLAVVIGIFLIFRELICWYWKINKGIALLDELNEQQGKLSSLLEKANEKLDSVCEELIMLRQQQLELSVRQQNQSAGDA